MSWRNPKGVLVPRAMHLLSVKLQRGDFEVGWKSGPVLLCEQGLQHDAGHVVPVSPDQGVRVWFIATRKEAASTAGNMQT